MQAQVCSTRESLQLDGDLKQVSKRVAEDIKVKYPEVTHTKKFNSHTHAAGCEPDGGIFWYKGEPIVACEGKHQGAKGNAIERWYKNNFVLRQLNHNITYITFATGEGAYPDRVIGKTLSPAHHLGYNYHSVGENVCYLRPEGISNQEMYTLITEAIESQVRNHLR